MTVLEWSGVRYRGWRIVTKIEGRVSKYWSVLVRSWMYRLLMINLARVCFHFMEEVIHSVYWMIWRANTYSGDWVYIRFGIYPVLGCFPKLCFQNLVLKENSKESRMGIYIILKNYKNLGSQMGIYIFILYTHPPLYLQLAQSTE